MINRIWHKGPPPHVGWWNASNLKNMFAWRWWDGSRWSAPAWATTSNTSIQSVANTPAVAKDVEWTHYWPEGARVPRINPACAACLVANPFIANQCEQAGEVFESDTSARGIP